MAATRAIAALAFASLVKLAAGHAGECRIVACLWIECHAFYSHVPSFNVGIQRHL